MAQGWGLVAAAVGVAAVADWALGSPVGSRIASGIASGAKAVATSAYNALYGAASRGRLIVGCGHSKDGVATAIHPAHQRDQDLLDITAAARPDIQADICGDLSWQIPNGTYTDVFFENIPVTVVAWPQGARAMTNSYRILQPGGTVRISTGLPPAFADELLAGLQQNVVRAGFRNYQYQRVANNGLEAVAQK